MSKMIYYIITKDGVARFICASCFDFNFKFPDTIAITLQIATESDLECVRILSKTQKDFRYKYG